GQNKGSEQRVRTKGQNKGSEQRVRTKGQNKGSEQRVRSGGVAGGLGVAPAGQQLGLAGLGLGQVRLLDVAVAADVFRHRGDLGGQVGIAGLQARQQLLHHLRVVGDQLPLHAPLGGAAEEVEGGAAQALHLRQQ